MMLLLIAIFASSSLDRLILATIAPALKQELKISDLQFGLLSGLAFSLLYTLGGLPIARLADRTRRLPILALSTAVWSAMTALSALTGGFGQLIALRIGVGLGEAGCSPTIYALLSEQYPPRQRASVVAVLGLGVPLGAALGAFVGGWSSDHGGWRNAFLIAGIPGLLLALLVLATLREPPRGHFDSGHAPRKVPPMMDVVRRLVSTPACFHMILCSTLCVFCANGLNMFLPSFFVRVHALSLTQAGQYFGGLVGIAAAMGTTGFGLIISRFGARHPQWYGYGPAIVMMAGVPLYLAAFSAESFAPAFGMLFLATTVGFAFLGPAVGTVQNLVDPQMRASAAAIFQISVQLVGSSSGTAFTGWASDRFARLAFAGDYASECLARTAPTYLTDACRAASATGLQHALMACSLFFVWAAFHAFAAGRALYRSAAKSTVGR
jgi:MFS family permease